MTLSNVTSPSTTVICSGSFEDEDVCEDEACEDEAFDDEDDIYELEDTCDSEEVSCDLEDESSNTENDALSEDDESPGTTFDSFFELSTAKTVIEVIDNARTIGMTIMSTFFFTFLSSITKRTTTCLIVK